jgi:hypothetical protein
MALPLSPIANAALNVATPTTSLRHRPYEATNYTISGVDSIEDQASSPFVANVAEDSSRENISPIMVSKPSPNPITREATSPLKMLKSRATPPTIIQSTFQANTHGRSPRKLSSPEKRFPVKVNLSSDIHVTTYETTQSLNHVAPHNEGLIEAIRILQDEDSMLEYGESDDVSDGTIIVGGDELEQEGFADETAFSTFSAVPDMTMFAKIGHSPTKIALMEQTPKGFGNNAPSTVQRPIAADQQDSPTPRRGNSKDSMHSDSTDNTNLILDFTEQFNNLSGHGHGHPSPTRRSHLSPTKSQGVPDLFTYTQNARTPSSKSHVRQQQSPGSRMSNLLDFDIPPAPTPRSMPSITPRELESLKSGFLSEISSLKASLSGKEAEVRSLKTAVGDAEKRVGESLEQVREERNAKEQLAAQKEAWEKRGHEMELVLRNVKEEIVHGEREREALEGRLEESEKRREAAEMMAQEAESKMAGMRAGASSTSDRNEDNTKAPNGTSSNSKDIEIAVEKVARELHTLYKSKHETKVSALKKSYESRWDKKVKDLQTKLDELNKENEELKIGRDATMSGVVPRIPTSEITEELRFQAAKDAQTAKELEARLKGLSEEVKSVKLDNAQLRRDLEQERIEKGELVAACDELLALQETAPATHPAVTTGVENLRGSISRASGLRAPNFASGASNVTALPSNESRIGKVDRTRSGSAQGPRPGSGLGMRSGIMSSIEKMGSYKARAD